jgi:hypothetical protein
MPRYLSLYTPAGPMAGPPSAEHMAEMGRFMDESIKAGKLIMTGALKKRDGDGFIVTQVGATCTLDETPKCDWMLAGGWAILQAKDRAEVVEDIKKFMRVAGDGRCEAIELFEPPPGM